MCTWECRLWDFGLQSLCVQFLVTGQGDGLSRTGIGCMAECTYVQLCVDSGF